MIQKTILEKNIYLPREYTTGLSSSILYSNNKTLFRFLVSSTFDDNLSLYGVWRLFDNYNPYTLHNNFATKNNYNAGIGTIAYFGTDPSYTGEYIMVDLNEYVIVNEIKFMPRRYMSSNAPKKFKIKGSNNNNCWNNTNHSSWEDVYSYNGGQRPYPFANETFEKKLFVNTKHFRYYAVIVNEINNTAVPVPADNAGKHNQALSFYEMRLIGDTVIDYSLNKYMYQPTLQYNLILTL